MFISWPIPCYPNGKLTQYDVERKNKDNATDIQLYDLETDFINITDGILPYRNYTFAVRAYTSIGPGNYTKSKTAKTHTAGRLHSLCFIPHEYPYFAEQDSFGTIRFLANKIKLSSKLVQSCLTLTVNVKIILVTFLKRRCFA